MNVHEPRPARRRRSIGILIAVITIAAVGAVIVRSQSASSAQTVATVAVTKEAQVSRGDIVVSESLDGSVVETDTIAVLHRIEGQTTSSSNSTPSAQGSTTATTTPTQQGPTFAAAAVSTADVSVVDLVAIEPTDTVPPGTAPTDTIPTEPTSPTTTPTTTEPTTPTTTPSTTPSGTGGGGNFPSGGTSTGGGGVTPGVTPGVATTGSSEPVTQVLTGIVAVGDTITSGDVLYTVESQPVIALRGGLPAWRTMSASSDDGADIYQLEAALVALGYDPDGDVTVDAHWDRATTAMVERWQAGSNIDVTGEVTLGSVVFIAHDAQVASTSAVVGDELSNGDEVLALTGTQQQVVIEVPTELQAVVQPGLAVSLGATTDAVDGTVTRLRSDDSSGTVTIQALIVPTTPLDLEAGSTTKVRIEVSLATDQLIVPTDAILSLLDGTYAVEVVNADGGHDITPVTIVAVSGSKTAVTGDGLTDTTTILTPA